MYYHNKMHLFVPDLVPVLPISTYIHVLMIKSVWHICTFCHILCRVLFILSTAFYSLELGLEHFLMMILPYILKKASIVLLPFVRQHMIVGMKLGIKIYHDMYIRGHSSDNCCCWDNQMFFHGIRDQFWSFITILSKYRISSYHFRGKRTFWHAAFLVYYSLNLVRMLWKLTE